MSTFTNVRNMLLETLFEFEVYSDFVPESETRPAVALTNVSFSNAGRDLEGDKHGHFDVFRVQVVAKSTSDVEYIIELLETLDNTKTVDFSRVMVQLINIEAKEPNQPYRRAFVDVRVYN